MTRNHRLGFVVALRIRYLIVAILIAVQAVTVFVVLAVRDHDNETRRTEAGRAVMTEIAARTVDRLDAELRPAEQSVRDITWQMGTHGLNVSPDTLLPHLTLAQMLANRQLDAIHIALADGRWVSTRRQSDGTLLQIARLTILRRGAAPPVTIGTVYGVDGRRLRATTDIGPLNFDPRLRPWFREATQEIHWAGPYLLTYSGRAGITASSRVRTARFGEAVVAAHVSTAGLSDMLHGVPTSPRGSAFIADGQGRLLGTDIDAHLVSAPGGARTVAQLSVGASGDMRTAAMEAYRAARRGDAPVFATFTVDGAPYLGAFTTLKVGADLRWVVAVTAPPGDFTGGGAGNRDAMLILAICTLATLIAAGVLMNATRPLDAIYRRATVDPLTGVLNRAELTRRAEYAVAEAQRHGRHVAVAALDLDGFKQVNDTLGHSAGDDLLRAFAHRTQAALRDGDLVGRMGGDEFVLLLPGLDPAHAYPRVADVVHHIIDEPVARREGPVRLATMVGLAVGHDEPFAELMERADQALVAGKSIRRGRIYMSAPRDHGVADAESAVVEARLLARR